MTSVEDVLKIKDFLFKLSDELTVLKGRGYGNEKDTLANLRLCEYAGVVDAETGTWIRLSDKVMRLGRVLQKGEEYVGFEPLVDTVVDAVNYLLYVFILRYEKDEKLREYIKQKYGFSLEAGKGENSVRR